MSLRLIRTVSNTETQRSAKVYRNAADNEWIVRFFFADEHLAGTTYFTDSREDAEGTALAWIDNKIGA